jgi:hypothetical protein
VAAAHPKNARTPAEKTGACCTPTTRFRGPDMGMSPGAKLIYGYALGGSEGGWMIKELDENDDWTVPWAAGVDIIDAMERVMTRAGVTAVKRVPHGAYFSENALVTFEIDAEWGEARPVDLAALEARRQAEGWDQALNDVIGLLGITPVTYENQEDRWPAYDAPRVPVPPRWMVVATYS